MDTDEFSEMAWDIIVRAARVSDTLKSELGMLSGKHKSENKRPGIYMLSKSPVKTDF